MNCSVELLVMSSNMPGSDIVVYQTVHLLGFMHVPIELYSTLGNQSDKRFVVWILALACYTYLCDVLHDIGRCSFNLSFV